MLLAANIVINEIHFDPDIKTEPVEFVELYNAGDERADLSSWSLADGISYAIPRGTTLAADAYLVISQDPTELRDKFDVESLGPFQGKLSNAGETISLLDAAAQTQDGKRIVGIEIGGRLVGDDQSRFGCYRSGQ